jgi:hypothetical protein
LTQRATCSCREIVVSSVRVLPGIPRRDWVARDSNSGHHTRPGPIRVLIDGSGFYGTVVQLEPLARRSPFPSLGGQIKRSWSRLKPPLPQRAGRTHRPRRTRSVRPRKPGASSGPPRTTACRPERAALHASRVARMRLKAGAARCVRCPRVGRQGDIDGLSFCAVTVNRSIPDLPGSRGTAQSSPARRCTTESSKPTAS